MSVAVVFLLRNSESEADAGLAFLDSFAGCSAGSPHSLVVLAKGDGDGAKARRRAAALSARIIDLPDDGYDFGAYFRAAAQLDHDWICLINTHSRIAADDWLGKLREAAEQPGIGAAGATGSWGTLTPRCVGPGVSLPGLAVWPWRFARTIHRFPRFPNPHLRSNALLLRRDLFLEFARAAAMPARKADAHFLESGRGGLSVFLRRQGLRPVVVGADGGSYESADWATSGTFRVPGQSNLLVSDNQTRNYDAADRRMRRILEFAAWGRTFTP